MSASSSMSSPDRLPLGSLGAARRSCRPRPAGPAGRARRARPAAAPRRCASRSIEPGGKEGGGKRGAALQQHVQQAARGQQAQRCGQTAVEALHLHAGARQPLLVVGRRAARPAPAPAPRRRRQTDRASRGSSPDAVMTTRTGLRPSQSRTVSRGSSARSVPAPMSTASAWARMRCTRRLALWPAELRRAAAGRRRPCRRATRPPCR